MMRRSIAAWLVIVAAVGCNAEPALKRQARKGHLINGIRETLLASVVAEKSAVLATTDEESHALALEAKGFAAQINEARAELRTLILADKLPLEIDKLTAFDTAWAEVEGVDQRLLALAVANTNLKAAQLSAREGSATLNRFVDALLEIQRTTSEPDLLRTLTRVSVAAMREQSLLQAHIPAADAEMTRLEQQMRELSDEVEHSMESMRQGGQVPQEQITKTLQTWSDYRLVVADVLRLSRQNTNVISFDVSVHEKRHATKDCLSALSALLAAVESGPQATR